MRHPVIAALTAAAAAAVSTVAAYVAKKQPRESAPAPRRDPLPISRIVMYQSGIGYVERCAETDSGSIVLRIRPDQINDILKSLTVIDRGNGRPVSISLPVDKDTLDSLAQIPDQIKDGGIRALLDAFRGANVCLKTRMHTYRGRIVGLENDAQPQQNRASKASRDQSVCTVTLLLPDNELKVIPLAEIRAVKLYDNILADGLQKSLNISLNEGNWKLIELTIQLDSSGRREIAVSYIVSMPTWKPAYRLVLKDDDMGILQGWAVVSNVTGADWNAIDFSLVSGQPMSFTFDLYKPQFLKRPDLSGLAAQNAAAPEVVASGYNNAPKAAPSMNMMMGAAIGGAMPGAAMGGAMPPGCAPNPQFAAAKRCMSTNDKAISSDEMMAGFAAQSEKSQIGSFDEYRMTSPLTLEDGHTALVNLLHNDIHAKDTRLVKMGTYPFDGYYKGWRENKSFQTIELVNDTGVALDAGPITLYRNSTVIGEGYLPRTEKDATAYITYANEGRLSVANIDTTNISSYRLNLVKDGCIHYSEILSTTQKFNLESHIDHPVTALLQFKRQAAWEPIEFPKDTVKSEEQITVPVSIEANSKKDISLTMKRINRQQFAISEDNKWNFDICRLAILTALEENRIPEDDKNDFVQFVNDIDRIRVIEPQIASEQNKRNQIAADLESLIKSIEGMKNLSSDQANGVLEQLLKREQASEQALAETTENMYKLQNEADSIKLRIQEYARKLKYIRK